MPNQIDFTLIGFDSYDNDFLNWCIKNHHNLQFLREDGLFDRPATTSYIHTDDRKVVQRIDRIVINKRRS